MLVDDPEALKSWLAILLSKKCDADPEALAKYILALVKKDKSTQTLKTFLIDQLEIFLSKETKSFVDLLFDALQTKSYLASLPNATAPADISVSSLPTKTICDVSNPPKDENTQSGSAARIESTSDDKDKSYRNREGSRKRSADDEHLHLKKSRPSFKSYNDGYYSSKPIKRDKNQESKNDGNYNSFHSDNYHSAKTTKRDKSQDNKNDENYKSRRSRSRSMDKDNSKSRSRSKSREREKRVYTTAESSSHDKSDSRILKNDLPKSIPPPHGDTDYRLRQVNDSTSSTMQSKSAAHSTRPTKRCQDYDEKGYCLKGDFCDFDHGTDPILVEHVSALNFGVNLPPDQFEGDCLKPPLPPTPPSIPPPPLPTVPPPLPTGPPPPLPPPLAGSFVPEPYNPEVPGMNMFPLNVRSPNFYMPPPIVPHVLPPPLPMPPALAPPFHNQREHRTRELIGVTTVDSFESPNAYKTLDRRRNKEVNNDRSYPKPLNSGYATMRPEASNQGGEFKSKGFDYSRLGPLPQTGFSRKCLEIRKIPKSLNNITNLHNHFGKFGNVVNIEIGCDNDPEAAKVSFSNHFEAMRAYRSTEPILNNRFIKVFWNNDSEKEVDTTSSREVTKTPPFPENIEEIPIISKESNEGAVLAMDTSIEISLPSKGPRTVVVSSTPQKTKSFSMVSPAARRGMQREAINPAHRKKMLELHQAKTELLKAQLENQKRILDQLIKAKNQKEKDFLKTTLLTITEQIKDLQNDLKKDNEELKNLFKSAPQNRMILKTAAKKELLDAELDLYNKEHNGDEDTSELVQKVNEMKRKAKALGVIESSPHIPKYPFRRGGNSRYRSTNSSSSLSIDRRPRKLLVLGSSDKEGLQRHFKQFGNMEALDEVSGGLLVTFCSRMEAEAAYTCGAKYKDIILNISWFNERQKSTMQNPDFIDETREVSTMDAELGEADEEEEEEEEDSEARSWRR